MDKDLTYFVADTHLGLDFKGGSDRERRFTAFLRGLDAERTEAVYLLGDIFDFWYEYRDVVPKGFSRVFAALLELMEAGVKVYFFEGNHDAWCYHYFEELGMVRLTQPYLTRIAGRTFCLGHGDGLGPVKRSYRFMRWVFHNRVVQALFSALHPWIAFRLGTNWSRRRRLGYKTPYVFGGESEPLYQFAVSYAGARPVDFFIFGHFHCAVDLTLPASGASTAASEEVGIEASGASGASGASAVVSAPAGARLMVLRDWFDVSNYIVFDGTDCRYVEM